MPDELPIRGHLILPTVLESAERTEDLDRYLTHIGVNVGRRTTYSGMLYALGASVHGESALSLAALFRKVGWNTKHTTYGAFTETRAHKANHDTVRERREVLGWLAACRPKFIVVDIVVSSKGNVLSACFAVPSGVCQAGLRRSDDGPQVVDALWHELTQAALALPLLTTSLQPIVLETVLIAASGLSFDHFAMVDPFFQPRPDAALQMEWAQPSTADGLNFADRLQSSGTLVGSGPARVSWVTINRSVRYMAYGPSRAGRYYLQRGKPSGWRETLSALKSRRDALDGEHLSLGGWPIEALEMRSSARFAYARMSHAVTMAIGYTLWQHGASLAAATPKDWTRIYNAWDAPTVARRNEDQL